MRREFIQVEDHWYRAFAIIIPLSSFCTTSSVHNSPLQFMTLVQALSPMSCRQKIDFSHNFSSYHFSSNTKSSHSSISVERHSDNSSSQTTKLTRQCYKLPTLRSALIFNVFILFILFGGGGKIVYLYCVTSSLPHAYSKQILQTSTCYLPHELHLLDGLPGASAKLNLLKPVV